MGGKTAQSTSQLSIPPEVMARYNSVNARAQQAAEAEFQPYTGQFVAPLTSTQQGAVSGVNAAQGMYRPYGQEAYQRTQEAMGGADPLNQAAGSQYNQAYGQGQDYLRASTGQAEGAYGQGQNYLRASSGQAEGAYGQGQDYLRASTGQAEGAFNQGQDYLGASTGQAEGAFNQGQDYLRAGDAAAYQASGAGQRAVNQAQEITSGSLGQAQAAVNEGQPYQSLATRFGLAGAQAVDPTQLGGQQIEQFMSPYLQSVVSSTLAPLRQQQQEEQSALLGNQIGAGAFGGDRGRIAQANLARQQEMATAQTVSGLMNQGYGQALETAQRQQGIGLGAAQANRAAQQQTAAQMAAIGQQGFGQQMSLAQQQAAIAQQIGALGQQNYSQGMGLSQQLQGLGAQGYQQRMGLSQQLQGLGAQGYQQRMGLSQQLQGLGAQGYQQGMGLSQQLQGLGAQGYQQGMGQGQANAALAQQIYGQRMGAGQQVGALGSQAQQNELAARQAQMGMGTAEQQTAQAQNQALYNQFLQQQGYPFQTAQFLANIAMGTGALSGSTTQTTQPSGFFSSDRRLKHDIRKIGKTDDGMPIYKFKYKGDPEEQTRIGFMADEVEKKKPEAVGLAGGYKTVDYDKATKAHGGGLSSEGGAVYPERAGLGFASGGSPIISSGDLDAILAAQAQGLGLYGGTGLYGGASSGMPGLSGAVPASSVHVPNLATAAAPAPLPESGLSELADTAGKVSDMVDTGVNAAKGVGRAKDAYDETGSLWEATKAAFEDEDENEPENYKTSNRDYEYGGGVAGPHSNNYAIGGMPYSQGQGYVPEQEIKTPDKLQEHQKHLEGDTQSSFGKDVDSLVKAGKTGAKLFAMSDRRLKHDIRKIGETTDGLPIYKFKYKGDPKEQTHIGFMADEVEKKHPGAVGLAGGYKTVDYDKATKNYARGGLAGRHGYQTRGAVTPEEVLQNEIPAATDAQTNGTSEPNRMRGLVNFLNAFGNSSNAADGIDAQMAAVGFLPQDSEHRRLVPQGGYLAPFPKDIDVRTRPKPVALRGDEDVGLAGASNAPPAEAAGIVPQGQVASNEGLSKEVAAQEAAEPGWFSRNQDWLVPLLKGVGTMAASPSRYLGAAALQGVGAAAGAYENTQQNLLDRQAKAAQVLKEQTGLTPPLPNSRRVYDRNGNLITVKISDWMKDQSKPVNQRQYFIQRPSGAFNSINSSSSVGAGQNFAGTEQPDTPTSSQKQTVSWEINPETLDKQASRSFNLAGQGGEEAVFLDPENVAANNVLKSYSDVVSEQQNMNELAIVVQSLQESSGMPGKAIISAKRAINGLAHAVGLPKEYTLDLNDDVSSEDIVQKLAAIRAFNVTDKAGQGANASLQAAITAFPSQGQDPVARREFASSLFMAPQQIKDLAEVYRTVRDAHSSNGNDLPSYYGVEAKFNERMSPIYALEKKVLQDLMKPETLLNGQSAIGLLVKAGGDLRNNPGLAEALNARYAKMFADAGIKYNAANIARYFQAR